MSKLREAARGQSCQIRSPVCVDHDHSTVVLAHIRMAGLTGVAIKAHDLLGAHACHRCHDLIDGRIPAKNHGLTKADIRLMHLEGMARTIDKLIRTGKVKVT